METYLKEWLWQSGYRKRDKRGKKESKRCTQKELSIIRYADDFLIIHPSLEVIQKGKEQIGKWLKEIGLEIKPSKTKITHTLEEYEGNIGFDFLGFTIRQFKIGKYHTGKNCNKEILGFKTIIKPSKEKALKHHRQLRDVIRKNKTSSQKTLIGKLNPIITGWCNYNKPSCAKKEFNNQDYLLWKTLWRWARRKHSNKSANWTYEKYWKVERYWDKEKQKYFQRKRFTDDKYNLKKHLDVEIVRHTKIKGEASPYDGNWVYWSTRMGKHPETPIKVATLLKKQKGKCPHCGLHFKNEDLMEIDHITPRSKGGKDEYKNLQLLHRHCHDVKTANDGSLNKQPDNNKTKTKTSKKTREKKLWEIIEKSNKGEKLTPEEMNLLSLYDM